MVVKLRGWSGSSISGSGSGGDGVVVEVVALAVKTAVVLGVVRL